MEAVVRRHRQSALDQGSALEIGELELRPDQFQIFAHDASAELTRREYEVMLLLAGARGKVLEREQIYREVWGYQMARGDRSVDVFIHKLRAKLERVPPAGGTSTPSRASATNWLPS